MQVLITGGTGFIGQALVRALLAQGHAVSVLTRDRAKAAAVLPTGATAVERLEGLAPEAVVNLAGENLGAHRWNEARKREFVDSRVGTTRRLVEWMATLPRRPRAMVSGSAVGYYGARGDEVLTEDAAPGRGFQSELCAKWEVEACGAETLGVRVCRIRTGIVLGPGGGGLAAMKLPFQLGLGGHLGSGQQWMSWIHRDDLVSLILWLLADDGRSGAYNATVPRPVTNREFAQTLATSLRRPALLPMPAFAVKLLVGEMSHLLLTGQRVVPARAQAGGFRFHYPHLLPALAQIFGDAAGRA
jgi:hypothetical protein